VKKLLMVMLFISSPAIASDVGASINAGAVECRVQSKDQIVCSDNGKICQDVRDRMRQYRERIFGCIDPKSKNYPCPPFEDTTTPSYRWLSQLELSCGSHGFQELKCLDPSQGKCDNWWGHGEK
jgi:hypothetical protein